MQTLSLDRFELPVRQFEPEPCSIAIIGMGSRGLSVLEQLIGLSRKTDAHRLRIEVFDPRTPGSGLHLAEQPDYLMLNTGGSALGVFVGLSSLRTCGLDLFTVVPRQGSHAR